MTHARRPLTSTLIVAVALALLGRSTSSQRSAHAVRIETPPVIDGVLDDAVWERATPLDEFFQIEPIVGAPTESTDVRVLYDADYLYVGVRLFDSAPGAIIATTRERDASLDADDSVELLFDTFGDRRNAYWFQMNAAGSKGDALISNNGSDFNKPWDGIWEGKSSIDELGWAVEIAIPFKTLTFEEGLETWGFNVMRSVGRKTESMRWSNANRDTRFFSVSDAGTLEGIRDIRQGVGLDVIPFFASNWNKDRTGRGDTDLLGEPGVDLFYRLGTNLTLSMTFNTDFAEAEVDERQVNLTRFPLFFPERRDFFLQDSGNFSFGNNIRPFFSRRIGLVDGEMIPLIAGAKLTGRVGDYNLGIVDVQTDSATTDASGEIDGQNLFVARVSRNVGEQSRIGGIVTNGNPSGTGDNTVAGLDANYRTTNLFGDKTFSANVWGLASDSEGISGDDAAFGASVHYPNDIWHWGASFQEIQSDFDAALGFVPRKDIREYGSHVFFSPRIDDEIRNLEFSVVSTVVTDTNDVFETWNTEVQPFGIDWDSGDSAAVKVNYTRDEIRTDFEISNGVVIPPGAYDFASFGVEFDSAEKRRVSASAGASGGEFFDGTRTDWWVEARYRMEPLLTAQLDFSQSDIDLDGGEFTTQIASARANLSFSTDLSWNSIVQWDNVSETVGLNFRVRWIPRAGRELFFVFNETLDESGRSLVPVFQQVAFKLSYTIRF